MKNIFLLFIPVFLAGCTGIFEQPRSLTRYLPQQSFFQSAEQQRKLTPTEVKKMVRQEAYNMGVASDLALAIAHAESSFNPLAESKVGARGVMQIMPATAKGEYGVHPNQLWDPRTNIRLGLHFFNSLLKRYEGRVDLALSYYNGGSRVGKLPNARVIPATRKYVNKVMRLRKRYS